MSENIIEISNVVKKYFEGNSNEIEALKNIDFTVRRGEFVAIVGESGSGKSTLMNIIGLIDDFSDGKYVLNNVDVSKLSDDEKSVIRNKEIGFVFQNFNLISRMTALKNVELPMKYCGHKRKYRKKKAIELLEMVGMETRKNHLPSQLSGGQNQRVAIARALANDPALLLADEPTGALDSQTSNSIMTVLKKLNQRGKTIVLITHSMEIANKADRVVEIKDGKIISN